MTTSENNENKMIARRYAMALLEFENETFKKEEILSEISDVQFSLDKSDDLQRIMNSPIVSVTEKKTILEKIFGESTNKIVLNFLKLLIDKNRFSIFNSIVKEYKNEINRLNGLLEIKVTSSINLNDSEKAMIKVKLKNILNRNIELDWDSDENIIGGLIFKVGDNIIDCSLRKKLQEIRKEITK